MPTILIVTLALLAVAGLVFFRRSRRLPAAPSPTELDVTLTMARRLGNRYNNLLSAILGHASLIEENATETQHASLRAIEEAVQEATVLTRSLMAYADGHPDEDVCDVADFLRTIAAVLKLQFDDRCRVELSLPDDPVPAAIGREALRRVVHDLCALAARTRGVVGITLSLSNSQSSGDSSPSLEASFGAIDPGTVMQEIEHLPSIRSLTADGRVHLPHQRSSVRLLLPALPSANGVSGGTHVDDPEFGSVGDEARPSILVVDDDESLLHLSTAFLERSGYGVLTAADGAQAVEVFAREQQRVIAIVLDLVMPVMNGREAFLHLKRIRNDVPIVLCTGYDVSSVQHLEKLGFAGFLRKPFTKQTMTAEIERVVAEARRATTAHAA